MSALPSLQEPTGKYLLDDVRSLMAGIRAQCDDIDTKRILPPGIIAALRQRGVFRLLAPRQIGGGESDPLTFLRIVEETSYADGSVGWCVMIGGCYSTFAGLLPPDGAAEVYGAPDTISAGAFRPAGVARPVEGGYRVSGRWQLGSGSSHANWYVGGCTIAEGDPGMTPAGRPAVREMFFPASDVEVIDTWESTGLRGTASHDYSVSEIFVPQHRTLWFSDPPHADGALYRMPVVGVFATYVSAVPLGIARHALETFIDVAGHKTDTSTATLLADRPVAQATLGRAHTLVTAGWTNLTATLETLWDKVQAGHHPTLADRAGLWLAATFTAQSALQAIELLYGAAGATSVYASSPLDRCLRDARTAVQHIVLQEANYEHYGRQLLTGEAAPGPWSMDYRSS